MALKTILYPFFVVPHTYPLTQAPLIVPAVQPVSDTSAFLKQIAVPRSISFNHSNNVNNSSNNNALSPKSLSPHQLSPSNSNNTLSPKASNTNNKNLSPSTSNTNLKALDLNHLTNTTSSDSVLSPQTAKG